MNFPNKNLDPGSSYYRICPSCHSPHMVHNRGRDYCSDKCYQDFYNATRRIKRIAPLYAPPRLDNYPSFREVKDNVIDFSALAKNISILKSLSLESGETKAKLNDLEDAGFRFKAYSYRYPISIERNIYCVEYGNFQTLLLEADTILIHIKN